MGAYLTAILLCVNLGLLAVQCTAGSALLPSQTASVVSQSAVGVHSITSFLPTGIQVCQFDDDGKPVEGSTTDINSFDSNYLLMFEELDQNITVSNPNNYSLESFAGLFIILFDATITLLKIASWLIAGYVLTIAVIPMPAEMALIAFIFVMPVVILQAFFLVSLLASILNPLR